MYIPVPVSAYLRLRHGWLYCTVGMARSADLPCSLWVRAIQGRAFSRADLVGVSV